MLVIQTVIILCILIFVHELGHFAVAKLTGVKVNEFAIGMGPAFFKRTYGDTKYSLRVFPIGGFCSMESTDKYDDDDEENDEIDKSDGVASAEVIGAVTAVDGAVNAEVIGVEATAEVNVEEKNPKAPSDPRAFENKPVRVRAAILGAGSFMNIILAILIMSGLAFTGTAPTTVMESVIEGSPAQIAGVLPGDRIVSIDGVATDEWRDIVIQISGTTQDRITLGIIRDGTEMIIHSGVTVIEDGRRGIGISPVTVRTFSNPFTALATGFRATFGMFTNMMEILQHLFTGRVPASDLVGPVGIAYIVDETLRMGMRPLLVLVALISLNLAIINLLPFPALDGGRLMFLFIGKITGKPINSKIEGIIHIVGIVLLLSLMLYVTWNDIMRFVIGTFTFWE